MSSEKRKPFSWTISGARDFQNNSILNLQRFQSTKEQNPVEDSEQRVSFENGSEEKNQKFGKFMGKLLLESKNVKNKQYKKAGSKAPKDENFKQKILTEAPYAGLFRIRKTRSDQPSSCNKIKFSLKLKQNESSTNQESFNNSDLFSPNLSPPRYRLVNGRRTRWDIKAHDDENSIEQVKTPEFVKKPAESEKDNCIIENLDDYETGVQGHSDGGNTPKNTDTIHISDVEDSDDCNSINSLQSDDDVLGPWIELGMVDESSRNRYKALSKNNYHDCNDCILNSNPENKDRKPFEMVDVCEKCRPEWNAMFEDIFKSKTQQNAKMDKQNQKSIKKMKLTNNTSKLVNTRAINKKTRSVIDTIKKSATNVPPTTSRYQQKEKNTNVTISEKSETTSLSTKESKRKSHITTGAFMTRKTAQELADPEHGFYPNTYGFFHKQNVEVLNLNGRWYHGTLEAMNNGKVKVRYDEWDDQEEWVVMGSRRLKASSPGQSLMNQKTTEVIDITTVEPQANEIDLTTIVQPLMSSDSQSTHKKHQNDYISDMLDKDPTQIFNNNEVFMTRKMARELVDEYGFKPNSFGYRRNRAVAIMFHAKRKGERKIKSECIAFLREMRHDQIRVWYPDLHISEWLPVGSRRLRVLSEKEESDILSKNQVDLTIQEVPNSSKEPDAKVNSRPSKVTNKKSKNMEFDVQVATTSDSSKHTISPAKKGGGRKLNKSEAIANSNAQKVMSDKSGSPLSTLDASSVAGNEKPQENEKINVTNDCYLTTGAFATRRAMRQLTDDHGFTPNPYGYTYNLAVEILNIRSGKSKFWEQGTLVAMRPGQVKVHYDGWADIYDEWIMVGSRRIRAATEICDESLVNKQVNLPFEPQEQNAASASASTLPFANEFLMAELNPEVRDDLKKNRKHAVVSAQDYQKLGLLVSVEELAAKEAKKLERREKTRQLKLMEKEKRNKDKHTVIDSDSGSDSEDDKEDSDHDEYTIANAKHSKKKHGKKKKQRHNVSEKPQRHKKSCNHHRHIANEPLNKNNDIGSDKTTTQIISLRLAQAQASKEFEFVANVYGYDYMQHVTVLHLDKKMYEGRLVGMNQNKIKVHYCGWLDMFDEEIPLGSRRIQPIENDHEVECIEPTYRERYEQAIQNKSHEECSECATLNQQDKQQLVNRLNRKRLTLDDVYSDDDSGNGSVEYHKDHVSEDENMIESENWKVYCNQCNVVIKQFRYYCTYCETPSQGYDYQSFELCLRCFDQNFPFWHEHPRSSFAIQSVIDTEIGPRPIKGELVTVWEEDILEDTTTNNQDELGGDKVDLEKIVSSLSINEGNTVQEMPVDSTIEQPEIDTQASAVTSTNNVNEIIPLEASKIFTGNGAIEASQGYKYLKKWKRRKVCAFCNDDDDTSEELGQFIGPFVIATFNKNGVEKKRSFWAHDSCARYSPEVFCTPEGKWYNVTLALRRGRGMRCHVCKEKGATIGCFESKCSKSFHLPCSQKPVTYFKNGVIFWCTAHEAYYNKIDTYVNVFNCDGCAKQLVDESWFTCVPCASSYFRSFDLCSECYEKFPTDHDHNEDQFEETSFAILKEMEAQKATEIAKEKEEQDTKKKKKPLFPRRRRKLPDGSLPVSCCYCGTYESDEWRKGYEGGVIMCSKCFEVASLIDNDGKQSDMPLIVDNYMDNQNQDQQLYAAPIEDYSHKPYLTRDVLSLTKFSESSTGSRLASYEPQENQLFSLSFDSTYFDIPGRAPRWATHSGTDYHGTWLPQTVRRAILKHTSKDERVLSNFLGRGTDAIECFLLQRRCCGIDINPAAVALSQRNCCFEIPPGLTSAEYRPVIAQADSRNLSGALFADESYHHVLSHPPYKDCVAYSTHLEGDLSRYTNVEDFKIEYTKVVKESYRLLKMCRRLTLGIGDNREHCFYIPVGFHLIRLYIDHGFELEELVIKRQRYCSAFGLGTYLCVQFDFLVFTHEFIATFKKVPADLADKMEINKNENTDVFRFKKKRHGIPSSAIMRKSVVMGTVWVFKPTETNKFEQLCLSRMVERFGRDESNWEHISLILSQEEQDDETLVDTSLRDTNAENLQDIIAEEALTSEDISEYERKRLKRIEENNKTLLKLGLISELSEESEDIIHHGLMFDKEVYPDGDLALMVTGHIPDLHPSQINSYRNSMIQLAHEAVEKLAAKGFLIIGTQDIRDPITGKLWPMTMLVLEDIEREVGRTQIKLKEMVVAVPDGYSKDRKKVVTEVESQEEEEFIDIETVENDHLPIVHAIYLIFQKF